MQTLLKLLLAATLTFSASFANANFVSFTQNGGGVRDYGTTLSLDGMTSNPISNYVSYTDTMAIGGTYSFDWIVIAQYGGKAIGGYLLNGVENELGSAQDLSRHGSGSGYTYSTVAMAVAVNVGDVFGWYLKEAPASRGRENVNALSIENVTFTPATSPSAVPVPAAAWLFGSALLGVAGLRRKQQA